MTSILITGGSGSFGKAFVSRLLESDEYDRICIYSRDEFKQFQMLQEIGDYERTRYFLGDIRDFQRLKRACESIDVVIHAAALKRIQTGFYCPDELVKTNINGSMNVIEAAHEAKVKKVIALSTDKAWQGGISPYGHSKALAESLFLSANNIYGEHGPKFSCVRYGNIWCSRGSIVPYWRSLKEQGIEKVPVTDPDCTRFFMHQYQAVDLVLNTINTMNGGELVIPEDLPAYRVGDLAEAMGLEMDIQGLPTWERKHEGMRDGLTSDIVRRLTVDELRLELAYDEKTGFDRKTI